MDSRTCFKDFLYKSIASQPALIFDYPHIFCASYGVFYPYSKRRYFPVAFFFLCSKFSSLRLLNRLFNDHSLRSVSLIACILIQDARIRKSICCVRYFFIMRLPANAWADKKNRATGGNDNRIFQSISTGSITICFFFFPL